MKKSTSVAFSMLIAMAFVVAAGSMLPSQAQTPRANADNTKMNSQEHDKDAATTAGQQKENRSDREITQDIRRSIASDKSLSTYAHNVKIITRDGQVTLKGPVHTDDEKKAIEAKATEIAGQNKVTNELNVKQ
jgi:osmotically-inducible protein OsmY